MDSALGLDLNTILWVVFLPVSFGLLAFIWYMSRSENSVEDKPIKDTIDELRTDVETRDKDIDAILLTTETNPDIKILERIEIVTAECVYGMHIFKDIFAGARDVVGGRSKAWQDTLRDARKTALYELKREAHEVGANAVVGVDLDYSEISGGRRNMLFLVASGTAVRIEK